MPAITPCRQPASSTANITAAGLTVTAKNVSMTYADGTTLNGTTGFTVAGLLGSDSVSSVTLATNATTSTSGNWNAGTWTITPSTAIGSGLGNYTITYDNASTGLTVAQRALAITGLSGTNKVYDSTDSDSVTGNGTLSGIVQGLNNGGGTSDVVTLNNGTASFANPNVGNGKTVTFSGYTISGADAGNYNLSQPAASIANITAAGLTINASDVSGTYGSVSLNGTTGFTSSGLLGGQTIGSVTLSTNATTSTSGNYNAGTWTITPGAATGGTFNPANYSITYNNASTGLTVTPLAIGVASGVTANNKVYDATTTATLPFNTPTLSGVIGGDIVSVDQTSGSAAFADANVANGKAVTVSGLGLTGHDAADYTLTQPTGLTANITPAALTVTANDLSKTYGNPDPAFTYTTAGLQGSDTAGSVLSGSLTRDPGENVGTYAITQGTLAANSNYTLTFVPGTLTITTANILAVAAHNQTMTYGGSLPTLTYTYSGLVNGDTSSVFSGSLATTATSSSNVGTYAITLGTLSAGANYSINFTGGTLTIGKATLDVTANSGQSKIYGTADPTLTYSYSGLQGGDTSSVFSGSLSRAAGENAGTYAIRQGTLSAGSNYTISYNAADFTINPATLTVTAADATKIYGAALPTLSYSYSGLAGGDTAPVFSGSLSTSAGSGSNVGTYAITQGSLSAGGNYTLSFAPGQLTVTPAQLTIAANDAYKLYGAANPAFTSTFTGLVNGDTSAAVSGLRSAPPAPTPAATPSPPTAPPPPIMPLPTATER